MLVGSAVLLGGLLPPAAASGEGQLRITAAAEYLGDTTSVVLGTYAHLMAADTTGRERPSRPPSGRHRSER